MPKIFSGIVEKGGQTAAALGFPTVNILLLDADVTGIYAGEVRAAGKTYEAVVYADQKRKVLEAHLFDFSGDLYGNRVEITLLEKLRGDRRFGGETELRNAIRGDAATARNYFTARKSGGE